MERPKEYKICTRCIMDTSDPEITFDEHGYCNHCSAALNLAQKVWFPNTEGQRRLVEIFEKIKKEGKRNDYDCIIGLSGGVDSSYLAYTAVKNGLRPLIVHIDCGWNSELAVKNIENIVTILKLELHTLVVDWEEMKDLQIAYLKANLANQDVPQDHAIFAGLYTFAVKNNIKYVLTGSNFATESILPTSWGYNALDYKNLKSIHKIFGKRKLKQYPCVSFFKRYIYYTIIKRMVIVKPLNYMRYRKEDAMNEMSEELGWKYYGAKHHESRFTKFFQAYYLPEKFGFDKRRSHLSSLIISDQITREQALEEMKNNPYNTSEISEDIEFIAKKLDMTLDELRNIMTGENRSYNEFSSNEWLFEVGFKIRKFLYGK